MLYTLQTEVQYSSFGASEGSCRSEHRSEEDRKDDAVTNFCRLRIVPGLVQTRLIHKWSGQSCICHMFDVMCIFLFDFIRYQVSNLTLRAVSSVSVYVMQRAQVTLSCDGTPT